MQRLRKRQRTHSNRPLLCSIHMHAIFPSRLANRSRENGKKYDEKENSYGRGKENICSAVPPNNKNEIPGISI